jgi:hypothetical protein
MNWLNAGAICFAAVVLAGAAQAQQVCLARDKATTALTQQFSEAVILRGITGEAMIEIWRSDAGAFSVVITVASGLSCMIVTGSSLQFVEPEKKGTGS